MCENYFQNSIIIQLVQFVQLFDAHMVYYRMQAIIRSYLSIHPFCCSVSRDMSVLLIVGQNLLKNFLKWKVHLLNQ